MKKSLRGLSKVMQMQMLDMAILAFTVPCFVRRSRFSTVFSRKPLSLVCMLKYSSFQMVNQVKKFGDPVMANPTIFAVILSNKQEQLTSDSFNEMYSVFF